MVHGARCLGIVVWMFWVNGCGAQGQRSSTDDDPLGGGASTGAASSTASDGVGVGAASAEASTAATLTASQGTSAADSVEGSGVSESSDATSASSNVAEPPGPVPAAVETGACVTSGVADESGNWLLDARPGNNYRFWSEVDVALTSVAPHSNLSFDWSGLTVDFQGHSIDPLLDIDTMAVILWELTYEEVVRKLNADELGAGDADIPVVIYTENAVTSGSLYEDFVVPGGGPIELEELQARFDPTLFDPSVYTFTAMPIKGGNLTRGAQSVHAFRLDSTSTNTEVTITSQSAAIRFDANIAELQPVFVPLGQANIVADWSNMEENAMGRSFKPRSVDQILIGRYSLSVEELEKRFLDLELIADDLYRGEVAAGSELSLAAATNERGVAFSGIDGDANWILALICSRCANPAPWYLTQLLPCTASE